MLLAAVLLASCADRGIGEPVSVPLENANADLAKLIDELLASIRTLPESAQMRGRLGMAYEVNDFVGAAADMYAQAEALDGKDFRWPYFRAVLVAESGDIEAALPHLDRAIAIDASYVPAWLYRGVWLNALGRYRQAREAFGHARELGATEIADSGTAQALIGEKRPQDALDLLEPLADQLRHPHVYRLLGRAYQAVGRTDDAKIAMARGRKADPMTWRDPLQHQKWPFEASLGRRLQHGERLLHSGRYEEAVDVLEAIRAKGVAEDAVFINLSLAYGRSGNQEQALAVAQEGFDAAPDNYRFHNVFAGIYQNDDDDESAMQHLQQSVDLNPAQVWPYERMADILMRGERYADALAAVDKALSYGAENPEQLYYTAGMLEGVRERWPAAVERFEQATALDASFTMAYIYLGRCLAEMGRFEDARAALAWAQRLGTHPEALASAEKRLADLVDESP